jgi:hypothetical protein
MRRLFHDLYFLMTLDFYLKKNVHMIINPCFFRFVEP